MKKGFSLVELSVVLIIIGILIAAVATSTKLIGNSKLRKVMQEVESMKSGINTFYASFDAYPGDFKRASAFFDNLPEGLDEMPNGNGDNFVEYNAENAYSWLHLASAQVIDGAYTGAMSGSGEGATPRENSPGSQYSPGVCYNHIFNYDLTGSTVDTTQNNIVVGTQVTNNPCVASTFLPKDAEFIDLKLDDGNPVNGNVRSYGGSNTNGTSFSAECIVDDQYNSVDLDQECIIGILF